MNSTVVEPTRTSLRQVTLDEFFGENAKSEILFEALLEAMNELGKTELRVKGSQIFFRRERDFAWVWMPAPYRGGKTPPLILSLILPQRDSSERWSEVLRLAPDRYIHHLEIHSLEDIDSEVRGCLRRALENS
jgi:hypothetical protein